MRICSLPGKKGQEPLAAVFIEEVSPPRSHHLERNARLRCRFGGGTTHQRSGAGTAIFTENLQATIEELEPRTRKLQATNEELLAGNEELQSTNEELQSVNEELHTVNTEYQSKILELTELNNDLDNLIASTRIATLFLDEDLTVRRFTRKFVARSRSWMAISVVRSTT